MKAVAATSRRRVELVDDAIPPIADYECLVRVRACGFCNGTDMKIIDDELSDQTVEFPVILGHEGVGEVVEVGPKVRHIRSGDAFAGPIGRLAPGSRFTPMFGHMKEYAVVQDHRAMRELGVDRAAYSGFWTRPVPGGMSAVDASILLTLKEAYSALRNFGFAPGMSVAVFGDGPVGLALATFLRMGGAGRVVCIGHHDDRLRRIAESAGVDLTVNSHKENAEEILAGSPCDLAIDAVGSTNVILQAARLLRPGAKVGVYGVLKKADSALPLLDLPNNTSVHMLNWPVGEHAVHAEVAAVVREGRVRPGDFYSHVLPAERAAEAVAMLRSREAFKVVLTM